jgi:hypothetical protein
MEVNPAWAFAIWSGVVGKTKSNSLMEHIASMTRWVVE